MSLSTYTMGGSERTEQNRIELSLEVRKCLVAALVHFTLCTRLCTRTPHQVSSSLVLVVNWYWSSTGTGHHGIFYPLPSSLRHHLGTHLNYRNTHTHKPKKEQSANKQKRQPLEEKKQQKTEEWFGRKSATRPHSSGKKKINKRNSHIHTTLKRRFFFFCSFVCSTFFFSFFFICLLACPVP